MEAQYRLVYGDKAEVPFPKDYPKGVLLGCVDLKVLSAVCCLLSAVCCLLSVVCCLLSAVCRLPSAVCRLLSAACCLLSAVCCLLSAACCLLSAVCCLPFAVCRLLCPPVITMIRTAGRTRTSRSTAPRLCMSWTASRSTSSVSLVTL
jgi:hypothetical protein